jgi:short-subunit dehydrogenase
MRADVLEMTQDAALVKSRLHFYKVNLAFEESVVTVWDQIVAKHGPVHILINNAARVIGKRVDELSIKDVKLTMDINFSSYVHLTMLFMAQKEIKSSKKNQFHMCNVISIAGHMTCQRMSDYSASKFALTGFVDALRQELEFTNSPIAMTNFYPYYINTGLFEGF